MTLPAAPPAGWVEVAPKPLSLMVLFGIRRTLEAAAMHGAAGQHHVSREDAVDAFVRLGEQLGIPSVVLRQLADDANSYDEALKTNAIVIDTIPGLDSEGDMRLCSGCHEAPEACMCGREPS